MHLANLRFLQIYKQAGWLAGEVQIIFPFAFYWQRGEDEHGDYISRTAKSAQPVGRQSSSLAQLVRSFVRSFVRVVCAMHDFFFSFHLPPGHEVEIKYLSSQSVSQSREQPKSKFKKMFCYSSRLLKSGKGFSWVSKYSNPEKSAALTLERNNLTLYDWLAGRYETRSIISYSTDIY